MYGLFCREVGRYEEAIVQYQKALEASIAVHGHEHESVGTMYQELAGLYQEQVRRCQCCYPIPLGPVQLHSCCSGKVQEISEMITKAYRIFLKVKGPDHPSTLALKPWIA